MPDLVHGAKGRRPKESGLGERALRKIRLEKIQARRRLGSAQMFKIATEQVVDDEDDTALFEKSLAEIGTDKTSAAGNNRNKSFVIQGVYHQISV